MELVGLESPYAGDVELNVFYARLCMKDCLLRGEAPFASHLIYTQPHILDDDVPEERTLGIEAGKEWEKNATKTVVYWDLGISGGMQYGIRRATEAGRDIEHRRLEGWAEILEEWRSKNERSWFGNP